MLPSAWQYLQASIRGLRRESRHLLIKLNIQQPVAFTPDNDSRLNLISVVTGAIGARQMNLRVFLACCYDSVAAPRMLGCRMTEWEGRGIES